jgi:hypothetical protein
MFSHLGTTLSSEREWYIEILNVVVTTSQHGEVLLISDFAIMLEENYTFCGVLCLTVI